MAKISKIKLPNSSEVYTIVDSTALHDASAFDRAGSASTAEENAKRYADGLLSSVLTFKGTKDTVAAVKSIASADKGDIWLVTADNSEWICIETISAADATKWEELGRVIEAASTTHTHNVTVNPTSTASVYSMTSTGGVTAGEAASLSSGFYSAGTAASYTGHSFTANVPTKLDLTKFSGGSFIRGSFSGGSFT